MQGFDEFMNVVIDEATEVYVKDAKPRRELGALLSFHLIGCRADTHLQVAYYSRATILR